MLTVLVTVQALSGIKDSPTVLTITNIPGILDYYCIVRVKYIEGKNISYLQASLYSSIAFINIGWKIRTSVVDMSFMTLERACIQEYSLTGLALDLPLPIIRLPLLLLSISTPTSLSICARRD
jgi:hypothetical protein